MREKERLVLNMENVNIKEQNLREKTNLVTDSKKVLETNKFDYENDDRELFYCYSERLEKFLYIFGKNYLARGLNPRGNNTFYVYKRDKELNYLLKQWTEIKKVIKSPFAEKR